VGSNPAWRAILYWLDQPIPFYRQVCRFFLFDRMLVAQAISEPMRLVTANAQVATYTELATLV
jgi:hypothetical protein